MTSLDPPCSSMPGTRPLPGSGVVRGGWFVSGGGRGWLGGMNRLGSTGYWLVAGADESTQLIVSDYWLIVAAATQRTDGARGAVPAVGELPREARRVHALPQPVQPRDDLHVWWWWWCAPVSQSTPEVARFGWSVDRLVVASTG